MLWAIGIALAALVLVSVGQVGLRRVRTVRDRSKPIPVARIVTALVAGALILILLRFGLSWIVVAGTALLGVRRWVFPLLRLLPVARFLANWAKTKRVQGAARTNSSSNSTTRMSRQEALKVLGLEEGATSEQIAEAYKSLILKLHPDHGGSSYLASKLNEARDTLL